MTDPASKTVVALLTGAGRSAVAVIAIRGSQSESIVTQCFQAAKKGRCLPGQVRFGVWSSSHREQIASESVVVTPVNQYVWEIHCHGGPAATKRILEDINFLGATIIEAADWSLSDQTPRPIHEAREVLSRCVTAKTAAIAMDQVRGALVVWATAALQSIDENRAELELIRGDAVQMCRFAALSTRLAEPFRVVLVGTPNVGKSSLVNAIVGYDRSITLDVAGTTRDVLHADTVIDGWPIRISDTAGIHDSQEPIEMEGISRARRVAEQADLVIHVSEPGRSTELFVTNRRVIEVLNKADLLPPQRALDSHRIHTVATSGQGIDLLLAAIAVALGQSTPAQGIAVPVTERQASILAAIGTSEARNDIKSLLEDLLGVTKSRPHRGIGV